MKKYIPLEKRSKKEQHQHHALQRGSWEGVIPVTKVIPNRKKAGRIQERELLQREWQNL